MSKTILITGIGGMIGANLADWIVHKYPEYTVVGIDDLSGGYKENINDKVIFEKIDLREKCLNEIFQKYKFDYVFHLAAYAAECLSPFIRVFNYENNLVSTANVINCCIKFKIKRLIFTSSIAVYGTGNPPFEETHTPCPIDPYGIAKYACEMDIKVAGEQHGLDWCIVRPHNVYGVKQNIWDKYRNVLGIWMYQILNKQPMSIFGDGLQKRAFSYIEDILEPLWKCAILDNCSKQIINLGGTKEYTVKKCNEVLQKITGNSNVLYLEGRHEVKNVHPTSYKSEILLNYKDTYSLEDGISKMWNWAKTQPIRKQFVWKEYEISDKIYSYWK